MCGWVCGCGCSSVVVAEYDINPQVTLKKISWSIIILNSLNPDDGKRDREVLSVAKLMPDRQGQCKTGVNVGSAVSRALTSFGVSGAQMDFCCSDNTAYNSGLALVSNVGGAYSHIWDWSRRMHSWILVFFIACLSHAASNEVKEVIKAAGPPDSNVTSYEAITGEKPKIMPNLPFGYKMEEHQSHPRASGDA